MAGDFFLKNDSLSIDNLLLSVDANLSAEYDSIDIKSAKINAGDIDIDIDKLVAKSAKIDVDIVSNLVTLMQKGTIEENQFTGKGQIKLLQELFERYDIPLRAEAWGYSSRCCCRQR